MRRAPGRRPLFWIMRHRCFAPLLACLLGLAGLAGSILCHPCFFVQAEDICLAAVPSRPGLAFSIRFIHSVQKTPVLEELRVDEDGHGFVLEATKYQSFGVGLPFLESEGEFRQEGCYYIMDHMDRRFSCLSLRTGVGTKLTVFVEGRELPLHELYPPGTRIDLFVAPWYQQLIMKGRKHESEQVRERAG